MFQIDALNECHDGSCPITKLFYVMWWHFISAKVANMAQIYECSAVTVVWKWVKIINVCTKKKCLKCKAISSIPCTFISTKVYCTKRWPRSQLTGTAYFLSFNWHLGHSVYSCGTLMTTIWKLMHFLWKWNILQLIMRYGHNLFQVCSLVHITTSHYVLTQILSPRYGLHRAVSMFILLFLF